MVILLLGDRGKELFGQSLSQVFRTGWQDDEWTKIGKAKIYSSSQHFNIKSNTIFKNRAEVTIYKPLENREK